MTKMKRKRFWKVTLVTTTTVVGLAGQVGRPTLTTTYNVIAPSREKAEKLVDENVPLENVTVESCTAARSSLKDFKGLVDYIEPGYE